MNLRPVFVSFSFFFKSIVFQNLTFTLWHTNNEFPSIFTTLLFCYDFFQLPKFDSLLGYNSKFHQPTSFTFINFLKLLNFSELIIYSNRFSQKETEKFNIFLVHTFFFSSSLTIRNIYCMWYSEYYGSETERAKRFAIKYV